MGKYEPLGNFLSQLQANYIAMSFTEIEQLLGNKLPASSKEHRAWWSNNPSNNVMTRQWLAAGYETESVDLAAEKLVFRKMKSRASANGLDRKENLPKTQGGGKYRPLGNYLRHQVEDRLCLTFDEIEAIIERELPASKAYPAWWSNNPGNNTMTQQWLDAGYQTESVDVVAGKLVFKRVQRNARPILGQESDDDLPDHPIWGCMADTITVMPGVDLTEPMEFEWGGKLYNE